MLHRQIICWLPEENCSWFHIITREDSIKETTDSDKVTQSCIQGVPQYSLNPSNIFVILLCYPVITGRCGAWQLKWEWKHRNITELNLEWFTELLSSTRSSSGYKPVLGTDVKSINIKLPRRCCSSGYNSCIKQIVLIERSHMVAQIRTKNVLCKMPVIFIVVSSLDLTN